MVLKIIRLILPSKKNYPNNNLKQLKKNKSVKINLWIQKGVFKIQKYILKGFKN